MIIHISKAFINNYHYYQFYYYFFRLSHKWDVALENLLIKTSMYAAGCGLASLVLFRPGNGRRLAFTTFGLGFGAGDAFRTASYDFDKEKK